MNETLLIIADRIKNYQFIEILDGMEDNFLNWGVTFQFEDGTHVTVVSRKSETPIIEVISLDFGYFLDCTTNAEHPTYDAEDVPILLDLAEFIEAQGGWILFI